MRFLHTSDWHLGASDGNRSLKEDQEYFLNEICRIIEEQKVDALLLAGDIYDTALGSAEAVRLYDNAMSRICGEMGKAVIAIAGNHDSADRLASCSDLLKNSGLHILGTLQREPRIVSLGDTDVYLLPWITEERVKNLYPEQKENIHDLSDAYRVACDAMRDSFVPGRRHICLAHAYIVDAETSTSDRAAEIGFAAKVDSDVFAGFDYVALGHIHKPQDVNTAIRYSGTPMPYSFGKEESQHKSVTIIDTVDMSHEEIFLHPLHCRTTLEGTLEELMTKEYGKDIVDGYVRLQVTDVFLGLEVQSRLRSRFTNILELSGKQYTDDGAGITMTLAEFESLESDPLEIFRHFCREVIHTDADAHQQDLFRNAMEEETV